VASEAKELIKGCLRTIPQERLTIDQVIQSKWVSQCSTVPQTPLQTGTFLKEQNDQEKEWNRRTLKELMVDQDNVMLLRRPSSALAKKRQDKRESEVSKLEDISKL